MHISHHHGINTTFSSFSHISQASSLLFANASHLQSFQPWSAAAHRIVPSAPAFHAFAQNTTFSSSDTASHLAVTPQGPQSAHCSHPTYASASVCLPDHSNMLPPSLDFYRLPSRGERQLALQRFGAAAGGAVQLAWRFALRLSSWGGGARITLAAAGDSAGRLGVAAHQLWRQVSAHCTVAPDACMHSLGAAFVVQLSDVLVASCAFLVRLSPVLQCVQAVFVSNV
jgi:hypothetical protein